MRPVVFGPSPLMQAALGVFKGQELGAQKVRAEEDRSDELAARKRSAQSDALTVAQRTISNDLASETLAQKRAKQARANAAAARLRGSEFNRSGWYGNIDDPADPEHDYDADYEKEAKISATKRALLAQGIPEIQAESAARHDVDQQAMAAKHAATRQAREKTAAEIERIKAQTAAERARAAREARSGDKESTAAVAAATREARDRRREMQSVLARRPKLGQFKDPGGFDRDGYEEALINWRADSTDRKGAEEDAATDLRTLLPGMRPAPAAVVPRASSEPGPTDDEIDEATDALLDAYDGRAPTPVEVVAEIERRRRER